MNYIREINAFYDLLQLQPMSSGQIALWHALVSICNKLSWAEWFSAPNQALEVRSGLSRQSVVSARNHLKQLGLIDFRTRGTKSTLYKIVSLCETTSDILQDTLQGALQDTVTTSETLQDALQGGLQDALPLNKHKRKPKQKQKHGDNTPPTPLRAERDELEGAIHRFVEHRKTIKKPMTEHAVKLLRDRLAQLAPDEETQIAMLDQAILSGWMTVYPLKDTSMQAQEKPNPSAQYYQQRSYKNSDLDHIFIDLDGVEMGDGSR